MNVACLILAAGEAKRFGFPKQILPWKDSTILGSVINEALKSDFFEIFVVLGAHYEKISSELSNILKKVKVIKNKNWKNGMFSSLICGISEISNYHIDYILVQLGDMPFVSSDIFNQFIHTADKGDFVVAVENNRPAHPYMFSAKYIPYILESNFKNGMKDFIKKEFSKAVKVPIDRLIGRQDIDTWEIYKNLKKFKNYIDK